MSRFEPAASRVKWNGDYSKKRGKFRIINETATSLSEEILANVEEEINCYNCLFFVKYVYNMSLELCPMIKITKTKKQGLKVMGPTDGWKAPGHLNPNERGGQMPYKS